MSIPETPPSAQAPTRNRRHIGLIVALAFVLTCGGCGVFVVRNFCWSDGWICPPASDLPIPPDLVNVKSTSGGGSAGCSATTVLLRAQANHDRERARHEYLDFLKAQGWEVTWTGRDIFDLEQVELTKPKEGVAIHVFGGEPYEDLTEGTVFGEKNRLVNPDLVDALQVDLKYDPEWDGCTERNLPK